MLEYQELLVIFMPDHSLPEVYRELRGFLTDQKFEAPQSDLNLKLKV